MKKPMRKVKKFEAGGLSKAQEDWLGGADRTDPIIMARMRKAVPDEAKTETTPAKAETKPESVEPAKPAKAVPEFVTFGPENVGESKVTSAPAKTTTTTASSKPAKVEEVKEVKEVKTEPKKGGYGRSGRSSAPSFAEDKSNPLTDEQKAESKSSYAKKMEAGKSQSPLGRFSFGDNKFSQVRAKRSMAAEGNYKKGGSVKMASGGKVSSASKRADGCALRGKTRA